MTGRVAWRALRMVMLLTVLTGFLYPAAVTLFAQIAFEGRADGSLMQLEGRPVGSRLIGQIWEGEAWFHGRPSAVDADASASGGSNLGPTSPELAEAIRRRLQTTVELERPYRPGVRGSDVPADLVTASGSGLDPHISPEAAQFQVPRIAEVRGLSAEQVEGLIDRSTDSRFLVFGRPGVNVLELNAALDDAAG